MRAEAGRGGWYWRWSARSGLLGLAALLAIAMLAALASQGAPSLAPSADSVDEGAASTYGKLPLSFTPNRGQVDSHARFHAQAPGLGVFFRDGTVTLALQKERKGHALELRFPGANPSVTPQAFDRRPGRVNYLTGADRSQWQTDIPTYGAVRYHSLWPGIDLTFKGTPGALKYEFTVHPGADPSDIRLAYAGAGGLSTTQSGALNVATPLGALTDQRPKTFQRNGSRTSAVQSSYALHGNTSYGFSLGRYDHSRPLIIDPGLAYSTFLGGSGDEGGEDRGAIATDGAGSAYVTLPTSSTDFPTTPGAFDATLGTGLGGTDAFVAKLDPTGAALEYSTYLGGGGTDWGAAIAVDSAGSAYVTGLTSSPDFPVTPGTLDSTQNGQDAFVTKLDPAGSSLAYSTYLGGSSGDQAFGIDVDSSGNAYVPLQTFSSDLVTTPGAYDTSSNGSADAALTKINPSGTAVVYSTYLGGPNFDEAKDVEVDQLGNAYLGGAADSGFPTTAGAAQPTHGGSTDAFAAKLDSTGSTLVYSTFLGGTSTDAARAIAIDQLGNAYVAGLVFSANFPVTVPGNGGAFVTKLDQNGSTFVYSRRVAGASDGHDVAVDSIGGAYLVGQAASGLSTTPGAFDTTYNGNGDAFLVKLDPTGATIAYGTLLGGQLLDRALGVAVDPRGDAYVTGLTNSSDFPVTSGAFDVTFGGAGGADDAFVTKLDMPALYDTPAGSSPIQLSLVPHLRQTISSTQCVGRGGTNSTHGPPLAFASCNPPRLLPGTVGRMGPESTGTAQLAAVPGDMNPGNGDQADLAVDVAVSDVRDGSGLDYDPNAAAPDASIVIRMRVNDTFSGPSQSDPATLGDFDYSLPVDCAATVDPAVGSDCGASTTMDVVTPGAILENGNTILQTFGIRLYDAGVDGTRGNSDDRWFAMGGIYIP